MYLKLIDPDGVSVIYPVRAPVTTRPFESKTTLDINALQQHRDIAFTHQVISHVWFDGLCGGAEPLRTDGVSIEAGNPDQPDIPFAFITNWRVYLLNNQGQTVDRLFEPRPPNIGQPTAC